MEKYLEKFTSFIVSGKYYSQRHQLLYSYGPLMYFTSVMNQTKVY